MPIIRSPGLAQGLRRLPKQLPEVAEALHSLGCPTFREGKTKDVGCGM